MTLLVVFGCVVVVCFAAVLVAVSAHAGSKAADRVVADSVKRRVVVASKAGESYVGVLFDADDRSFVLVDAATPDGDPIDGQLVVLRDDVAYVQVL